MSTGLDVESTVSSQPSLDGTYASSIGFHSNGAVYLDGKPFVHFLYPFLGSSFDVMALVNLGQGKFWYAPANTRRTVNPCFVPAASAVNGRSGSMGLDFDNSGDLFSMGRVDSGWLEVSKSRKDNGGAASVGDQDADSDLFEISL
ncbi:hypothetical protein GUJ93_ZPchr0082g22913 [Zizania palustris]|uniref:Uncharacterized protein n=1 Tax=Zizania palustris TaxID=103762 RepID=A0A8J5V1Z9_ZIZPA|nr:hypothetical protein GUJ93_ZPchr0082g22913 [Zizania palustris]